MFHITAAPQSNGSFRWKLQEYIGTGTSMVVESNQSWETKAEAEVAATRANAGNKDGISFAMYADD